MSKELLEEILEDIRVEITEEFDRNFERKAFFSKPWKPRQRDDRGSLLVQTGNLRRSIRSRTGKNCVIFTSSEPYAALHNDGGVIVVTPRMKRFFWAKYYETAEKIKYKKSGGMSKSSAKRSAKAKYYKALALKKVGTKITIPQRQFIGDDPQIKQAVTRIVETHLNEIFSQLIKNHL